MKLRLSLLTCGSCGKPRGRYHACAGKRGKRDRLQFALRFRCGACGKETPNLFRHTCSVRTDWAKRRRAAERAAKAKARRERRKRMRAEAAKRRKAAERERRERAKAGAKNRKPRASPHNPRTCTDSECTRYGCVKYREGFADGVAAGSEGGGDG